MTLGMRGGRRTQEILDETQEDLLLNFARRWSGRKVANTVLNRLQNSPGARADLPFAELISFSREATWKA